MERCSKCGQVFVRPNEGSTPRELADFIDTWGGHSAGVRAFARHVPDATVGTMMNMTESELRSYKGFGERGFASFMHALDLLGLV